MRYEFLGRLHARLAALRQEGGQGTVEYVGLILLLAVILAGVVSAAQGFSDDSIAKTVIGKLEDAIKSVGKE